ncbi:MAG: ribosome small subunit-dependent GTPase A [Massiliimalia sp.]|jgi:ribosome biogenesis GTPase
MEQREGLIVKALGGFYYVETAEKIFECRARGVFRKRETSPVVGDQVVIEGDEKGKGTVVQIKERKNFVVRPPLANLDQIFIVSSMCEPVPNTTVIDEFIAMSEHKGIEPILVFTKSDLKDPGQLEQVYRNAGFQVLCVDNLKGGFEQQAKQLLAGKISAFTGNTGVGKSSFLNALYPGFGVQTGEVSQKLGRGRHTTRHVELYKLEDIDAYVADTPGFSSMDLMQYDVIRKDQLQYCFREFEPYWDQCRFTGCSHTVEKGCAVLEALAEGKISQSRHDSYVALYDQAKQIKDWELK